jgi:hypothetical protein
VKLFVLILSALLFAVGCAESGSGSKDTVLEQTPEKPRGTDPSCLYGYTQGANAPSGLLSERIVTTFFGKRFDENKLIPLLDVSGSETVRFAELTGVRFYKTNYFSQKSCSYTISLPSAPIDIRQVFDKGGSNVLGLYLPKKYSNLQTVENGAAIQVRIDSDRWTLTHEFMHHLFSTLANQSGVTDDELKSIIGVNIKDYEQAINSASVTDIKAYVKAGQSLSLVNVAFQELMRRFSLEEMTIETLLAKKYDQAQFTLVAESQRENGAYYIVSSAKKAREPMTTLSDESKRVVDILKTSVDTTAIQVVQSLTSDMNNYNKLFTELQTLELPARDYINKRILVPFNTQNSIRGGDRAVRHAGCSHTGQIDEIVEQIKF